MQIRIRYIWITILEKERRERESTIGKRGRQKEASYNNGRAITYPVNPMVLPPMLIVVEYVEIYYLHQQKKREKRIVRSRRIQKESAGKRVDQVVDDGANVG